jgi:CRISPR/Cas system-associated protein Cas10 (large subunit of type III CRISPR-Cas system)
MGEHFKTDMDQLGQFLKTLESCVRDLDEARTALAHVRADQIGTKRLDEACDGFQERWKYGFEQTKEMVEAVSEGVKSNKKAYEEVEDALEKAFKEITERATSGQGGAE